MPRKFKDLLGTHKTSHDIEPSVRSFCSMFSIDSHRCANELYSFATYFGKFDGSGYERAGDDNDSGNGGEGQDNERDIKAVKSRNDGDDATVNEIYSIERTSSFVDAIKISANPSYHLWDAYPTLC